MKITMTDLYVLLQVLSGSLSIVDRKDMSFFGYGYKTRKELYDRIVNNMRDIKLEVEENKEVVKNGLKKSY